MRKFIYLSGLLLFLSSCAWLTPNIMLKTGKGYQYAKNPDSSRTLDYNISPNDIISFNIYSNDGFKLLDLSSLNSSSTGYKFGEPLSYLVESDGNVKLPIVGRKNIKGLTIREAELKLEEYYSVFYVRPFVELKVTNRRVIVFPGMSGSAKVIPLINNNTSLIEALALAGGVFEDGKAKQVKLIRDNNGKHDVFLMDLSTIQGIKDASTVLQSNDIIYVEPRRRYSTKFLTEAAPILSLISSTLVLFLSYKTLTK